MKVYVINQFGDPDVFTAVELSKPELTSGHVMVRVKATSVNPVDCKIRSGSYAALAAPFPTILHGDVAGIVEAVAPDVKAFKPGDEVFGCAGGLVNSGGALAEFMIADAKLLAKKPRNFNMKQAAALPLVSITAWEALVEKVKIKPGDKVLIHAGTGGVGHIAVQLAKWLGATVYATVSSDEKAAIAKSVGADETINYKKENVPDYVNRLTNGEGFDVVLDTVGGSNINTSLDAVKTYGNVVTILAASTIDLSTLHQKSANLHAVFMLIPLLQNIQRERHGAIMEKIAELADEEKITPLLDAKQFDIADISSAHAHMESGKAIGKIVVTVS